jgi:hypothetical protein
MSNVTYHQLSDEEKQGVAEMITYLKDHPEDKSQTEEYIFPSGKVIRIPQFANSINDLEYE